MVHKFCAVLLALITAGVIIVSGPESTSDPAASPADKAKEDLGRFVYPSQAGVKWKPHFIMPQESLERLFGEDWLHVARFNRIDRRHVYPGMTIKRPENVDDIKEYSPMPLRYERAAKYAKYVLVDIREQWLGAYEYGELQFSTPAATGVDGHLTPLGIFKVDARDQKHSSSLYKTRKGDAQYPMDYAVRFHIDKERVSYWIHARDMPGKPVSHGCIGLYDEQMQKRVYGVPAKPVINDAARLYHWVADEALNEVDDGRMTLIADGPTVEIRGELPQYLAGNLPPQ
jgi:lipoprotein-anchoring transpeptidase ErfK/SrfK